jgi:hypothetical protein
MLKLVSSRRGWAGALVLLALGGAGLWTLRAPHEIAVTQQEIQARLDGAAGREIALTGSAHAFIPSLQFKSAEIVLIAKEATIAFEIEGRLRTGRNFTLAAMAQGTPTYVDGAIYFEPSNIEATKLAYAGSSVADLVRDHANNPALGDKARKLLANAAGKIDAWAQTAAETAMRQFLESRPIYRLKDDVGGKALKAALEKIEIEDGRVVATFTLWRLTATAIAGALSLLLGVALTILLLRAALAGADLDVGAS